MSLITPSILSKHEDVCLGKPPLLSSEHPLMFDDIPISRSQFTNSPFRMRDMGRPFLPFFVTFNSKDPSFVKLIYLLNLPISLKWIVIAFPRLGHFVFPP